MLNLNLVDGGRITGDGLPKSYPRSEIEVRNGELVFGAGSQMKAPVNIAINNAPFVIGRNTTFGGGLYVSCFHRINIGENCRIARDVIFRDNDGHNHNGNSGKRSIVIGRNVWIGMRAIILKGATVGDGSIIGAGAVVTGRVYPPNSLIVGNPAKIARTGVSWSD